MKSRIVTGMGFDSHLFSKKGTLKLGGVSVPGCPALKGHSDGDALLHAVTDALLGAASLGDIGEYFPDTKKEIKGISSLVMLSDVVVKVKKKKLRPTHLDVTVLANRPKMAPLKEKIKNQLSKSLQLSASHINIKAKTQEGLNLFAAPGGIAVWAVINCKYV